MKNTPGRLNDLVFVLENEKNKAVIGVPHAVKD